MDEDLSLDEIIEQRRKRNPNFANRNTRDMSNKPRNYTDSRNGSHQKTQAKRHDARNTLNQKKWRQSSLPPSRASTPPSISWRPAPLRNFGQRRFVRTMVTGKAPWDDEGETLEFFQSLHRSNNSEYRNHMGYVDLDNMRELEEEEEEIARTIQVDSNRKKPSPPTVILDTDDEKTDKSNASPSPPRKKKTRNVIDGGQRKIVASTITANKPICLVPHEIDANEKSDQSSSMTQLGFRVLVSNLDPYVTTSDIHKVFSRIGPMYEAKVLRPGTAEVVYKSLEHAKKAVKKYHRRELDGQPMHCVLINAQSPVVEVDIDALHSVLFGNKEKTNKFNRPLFSGKVKVQNKN